MNLPLLEIKNLSLEFPTNDGKSQIKAVNNLSLTLEKGKILALVGESGSGKSLSALSVIGLQPGNARLSGQIFFDGAEVSKLSANKMRRLRGKRVTMVFQEPMSSLNPLHTIENQIAEALQLHGYYSSSQIRQKVIQGLEEVGIPNPASRLNAYPHQLSGGQRQRVMIAMALINRPDLLIADEPTTALDVTVQAQILALLKHLQLKLHLSILFITHDLGIVHKIADEVAVMQNGALVEKAPTATLFAQPNHPYTKALLAAEPKGQPPTFNPEAPVLLTTKELKVWFPIKRGLLAQTVDHIKAVDGITLNVRKGQTIGIVGESGSGKTTLGLAILRLIRSQGTIIYLGQAIDQFGYKTMRPLRKDLQIVFQDPYGSLSPRLSIAQIIEEGLVVQNPKLSLQERHYRVSQALQKVGLDATMMNRYPHEFSGGQRQRIAIARTIILGPKLVVLDEPTSALDRSVQVQIVDLLRQLQTEQDLAYLFISHDLKVVRALASELIIMRHGKVVEAGIASTIFADPQSDYTRTLFKAAFENDANDVWEIDKNEIDKNTSELSQ